MRYEKQSLGEEGGQYLPVLPYYSEESARVATNPNLHRIS